VRVQASRPWTPPGDGCEARLRVRLGPEAQMQMTGVRPSGAGLSVEPHFAIGSAAQRCEPSMEARRVSAESCPPSTVRLLTCSRPPIRVVMSAPAFRIPLTTQSSTHPILDTCAPRPEYNAIVRPPCPPRPPCSSGSSRDRRGRGCRRTGLPRRAPPSRSHSHALSCPPRAPWPCMLPPRLSWTLWDRRQALAKNHQPNKPACCVQGRPSLLAQALQLESCHPSLQVAAGIA
jgi:hypothetical protein